MEFDDTNAPFSEKAVKVRFIFLESEWIKIRIRIRITSNEGTGLDIFWGLGYFVGGDCEGGAGMNGE